MTPEERIVNDRTLAQSLLDGTLLVPRSICRNCGSYVRVGEGRLEKSGPRQSGIAIGVELAVCIEGCRQVTATMSPELKGIWRHGSQEVVFVGGPPHYIENRPQIITEKQKVMLKEFLAQTIAAQQ